MKILIVYEEIPEDTKLYSVEVTPEEWKWMQLTQDKFINASMPKKNEQACNKLSEFLTDKPILSMDNPILIRGENYDYVLVTGFIL